MSTRPVRITHRAGPSLAEFLRVRALNPTSGEAEELYAFLKAAAPAGSTSEHESLAGLRGLDEMRERIVRRLLPARLDASRLPFSVTVPFAGTRAVGSWTGEGKAKPVTRFGAEAVVLPQRKVAAPVAVTKDLLRDPSPEAEAVVLRLVEDAVVKTANATFASDAPAVSGVSPAGIGAGATGTADTGDLAEDLVALVAAAEAADADLTESEWILSPSRAVEAAAAFGTDTLGLRGGTLLGAPAHTDPDAETIYLVHSRRVALALGGIEVDVAPHAAVQLADNPAGNSIGDTNATTLTSLWQTNSVGFMAELTINWVAAADAVFALGGSS